MKQNNATIDKVIKNFNSNLDDVKIKYLLHNMVYTEELEDSGIDIDLDMVDQSKSVELENPSYYISLMGNFIGKKLEPTDRDNKIKTLVTRETKSGRIKHLAYPLNSENRTVLEKVRQRMANMKRFYPELYYRNESIIAIWGNTDISKLCNQKMLNFKNSSLQ